MRKIFFAIPLLSFSLWSSDISVDGMIRGMSLSGENANTAAIGGRLGVSATKEQFFTNAAFYTTNAIVRPDDASSSFFTNDGSGYSILGEAAVGYKNGSTVLSVGRQKIDTPLIGPDDGRIVPNLYEAASLKYQLNNKTSFEGYYISKMSGFWSQIFGGDDMSKFVSMSKAAGYGNIVSDGKVYTLGAKHSFYSNKASAWAYHSPDLLDLFYADVDFEHTLSSGVTLFLSMQGSRQTANGKLHDFLNSNNKTLDQTLLAAKIGASHHDITISIAGTKVDDSDGRLDKNMMNVWAGIPQYTVSNEFVMKSFNTDGATMYKLCSEYKMDEKTTFNAKYLIFQGAKSTGAKDESLVELIASYKPIKNLFLSGVLLFHNIKDSDSNTLVKTTVEYRF